MEIQKVTGVSISKLFILFKGEWSKKMLKLRIRETEGLKNKYKAKKEKEKIDAQFKDIRSSLEALGVCSNRQKTTENQNKVEDQLEKKTPELNLKQTKENIESLKRIYTKYNKVFNEEPSLKETLSLSEVNEILEILKTHERVLIKKLFSKTLKDNKLKIRENKLEDFIQIFKETMDYFSKSTEKDREILEKAKKEHKRFVLLKTRVDSLEKDILQACKMAITSKSPEGSSENLEKFPDLETSLTDLAKDNAVREKFINLSEKQQKQLPILIQNWLKRNLKINRNFCCRATGSLSLKKKYKPLKKDTFFFGA